MERQPEEWPEWVDRLRRRMQMESPGKRFWAEKAGRALLELMDLSEESLTEAAEQSNDCMAIIGAMSAPDNLRRLLAADPLAGAFLRGIRAKEQLLKENGGVLTTEQAAQFLDITPQAVNKRRTCRKLLGLTFRHRGYRYPRWQFDELRGTVPGLERVLMELREHDEWMQNIFFVSPNMRLGGRRPVDLLREHEIASVLDAAKSYGEHGAV